MKTHTVRKNACHSGVRCIVFAGYIGGTLHFVMATPRDYRRGLLKPRVAKARIKSALTAKLGVVS